MYLNGELMDLILIFNYENPRGFIAGARPHYSDDETQTVARLTELKDGDRIEFLCDYYTYDGVYQATYKLGSPMIYTSGKMVISNTDLGGKCVALYRFTDIYGQYYWTLPVPQD